MDKTNYDIDMLILAASPLINDINEVPFEWIINVDKEINELLSILLKSKKKIKVTIDILNSENIKKYFSKKIRFCHLSSHGSIEYKYGKKMFYLYGDKVGICEKISKKELIDILDKINNLEVTKIMANIKEKINFPSEFVFSLLRNRHYFLLSILAKIYPLQH